MGFITRNFKWLMLVSGLLTATMFYGLFAPQAALESMFGASFDGQLQSLVVRSWSALVGLMGVMLIYGQGFLVTAAPALGMDLLVIAFTLLFLLALRRRSAA